VTELTPKQKRFVAEYLIDLNATQAAIRAGYSKNTAVAQGGRLLANVNIAAAVQRGAERREKRTEITQDKVLRELAAIGFYDILDFAEVAPDGVSIKLTAAIPIEKRGAIAGIKTTQAGIEVKMADKLRALELIGKHLGLFGDKTTRPQDDAESDNLFEAISEAVKK
jgi:phage terminase small subunit